jgi:cytochrome P450
VPKSYAELPEIHPPEHLGWTGQVPSYLAEMALEHGPLFRWRMRDDPDHPFEVLFMVGPEANRFVMHTHREHFSHDQGWTPIVGEWMGHGLLNMDPPEWTLHRRMMNPAFTSAYLAAYLPIMQRVIDARTRDWPDGGEIDLYHEAREITFDIAAEALAGFRSGAPVDKLRELFSTLIRGPDLANETWDQFLERRTQVVAELDRMLLPLIAERKRALETGGTSGQPRDVLGMIVEARDDHGQPLDDEQILAHVKILLVAGHETTTTLSTWTLFLLATHPEYLRRVRAELDSVVGGEDGLDSYEAIRGLKALDNVVKEAGRLYSPVISVPRGVVEEFEFADCLVPAGVQVRLSLAACHRLPHVFANPGVFDPERFEPPREEDKRAPYALVTFGGGPRVCIGMGFAQEEIKAFVAHVVRRHRLEIVNPSEVIHADWLVGFLPSGCRTRIAALR